MSNQNVIKLSSIVIAKNEEKNIKQSIESQLDCIDNIIVIVDKDSTDNTLSIIKSFPQINYEIVEWRGYSKTKEYALSKTKHDWVLWIDADEAITPALSSLRAFLVARLSSNTRMSLLPNPKQVFSTLRILSTSFTHPLRSCRF